MKEIILIGAGGHALSCIDVIEKAGQFKIAGLIGAAGEVGKNVLGYPVIGVDEDIPALTKKYGNFLITVGHMGNGATRQKLFDDVKKAGGALPVITSPLAYVSKHAQVGEGVIIMHHALVNAGAVIGPNCIINTKALVEHGANVGANCHIATAAVINGDVSVGGGSFIGSGAITKQGSVIAPESFIKAGSVFK